MWRRASADARRIRNYAVAGGFYLTTSQFGPNLYLGNNPRTDGTAGSLIAAAYVRASARKIQRRRRSNHVTQIVVRDLPLHLRANADHARLHDAVRKPD
jgi:hypothetical protein